MTLIIGSTLIVTLSLALIILQVQLVRGSLRFLHVIVLSSFCLLLLHLTYVGLYLDGTRCAQLGQNQKLLSSEPSPSHSPATTGNNNPAPSTPSPGSHGSYTE